MRAAIVLLLALEAGKVVADVGAGRGELGVPSKEVVAEVAGSGFDTLQLIDDWPGRGPLGSYCVVFRKPRV
jgi:hypothetical protein